MPRRWTARLLAIALCAAALPGVAWAVAKQRDGDRDKLPDRWEKRYSISTKKRSAKRDPDHDRLNNRREYRAHTHPRRADTDRDGLNDYVEVVKLHTNPRRKDTDGDGFSDLAEVRAGTNPRARGDHPSVGGAAAPAAGAAPPPPSGAPLPSCAPSTANVAGGKDPFGGCWPGAANTGVPPGTALTSYTGPCTITTANAVISAKTVNCVLNIAAANVQIRNSKINGGVWIDDPDKPYSFTITDSEVDAGPETAAGETAIGKSHFTATRVDTHGGIRGVWCEFACTVQDSWIHGQATDSSGQAHESAVRMGDGSVIRHNTLHCDAPNVPPDAGCSADLTGYGDFAPIRNNTIDKNLFLATPAGTCAYGGSSGADGSKPYGNQAANIVFSDNIFQRRNAVQSSGKCGAFFPITDFDTSRSGNRWTNNRWDDGSAVAPG